MVTVIWAAAGVAIITDGAEAEDIITDGVTAGDDFSLICGAGRLAAVRRKFRLEPCPQNI